MEKIKAIIKRPDEQYGHVTNISNTLKNLQSIVDGQIQAVPILPDNGVIMICNEDGKNLSLERNFGMGYFPFRDIVVGTVIICGAKGEDFGDVPIDIQQWKRILNLWGN